MKTVCQKLAHRTIENYRWNCGRFIREFLGGRDLPISQISDSLVASYKEKYPTTNYPVCAVVQWAKQSKPKSKLSKLVPQPEPEIDWTSVYNAILLALVEKEEALAEKERENVALKETVKQLI